MPPQLKLNSIENDSILRRFTILFVIMSLIPICILYYLYVVMKSAGQLIISPENLNVTLMFVVVGVIVGYLGMRISIKRIIHVTQANRETFKGLFGEEAVQALGKNQNEISVLTRTFSEITSRLEENIKSLELTKRTLHSVLEAISQGIASIDNIDKFLNLIVQTMTEAFGAKVGVLMLKDEEANELYPQSVYGTLFTSLERVRLKIDQGSYGWVVKEKKPLMIPKLEYTEPGFYGYGAAFETPVLCAPLLLRDKVLGVISFYGKKLGNNFEEEEIKIIYNVALQTAIAIENARLNKDAEKTYFETISALALAVEAKDSYSRGHLDRVAEYTTMIARKLKLNDEKIKILRDAARLHDIGKIGIMDEILLKPATLTEHERMVMKKHTEIGESIIKPIRSLRSLCDVIRHHHEFLDGSGYPDGLQGDQISLLTRILTISDIFDALTTDRPYRKALTFDQAAVELHKMEDKLDQSIVNAFLEALKEK